MPSWTFDASADIYGKMRPGYPSSLYKKIFDYANLQAGDSVLEIGIGAGNATPPFLDAAMQVIAVEPGKNFANLCACKFAAYPNFEIINAKFEDYEPEGKLFNLIYAATAFHWLPEKQGFNKVYSLLKSGGVFARFANHPFAAYDAPALRRQMYAEYAEYYYKFYKDKPKFQGAFDTRQARAKAEIASQYGFTDAKWHIFQNKRCLCANDYILLLQTYSDHMALPGNLRHGLFAALEEIIDANGGYINILDTIDLELCKKP